MVALFQSQKWLSPVSRQGPRSGTVDECHGRASHVDSEKPNAAVIPLFVANAGNSESPASTRWGGGKK